MKSAFITFSFILTVLGSLPVAAQKDFQAYEEGIAKFKASDYAGSVEIFTAIINNPEHNKKLDEDLYYYRGQAYYHQNEYRSALTDLDQSLLLDHYNKGIIYWYKARCYDKIEKKNEAVRNYSAERKKEHNEDVKCYFFHDKP